MIRMTKAILAFTIALSVGDVSRQELLFIRVVPDPLTNGLTQTVVPDGDDCTMHGNYLWYCHKSGTPRPPQPSSGNKVPVQEVWHGKAMEKPLYIPIGNAVRIR